MGQKLNPARVMEDQEADMGRSVVSTPPFSSPDPGTEGLKMALIEEGGEDEAQGADLTVPELKEKAKALGIDGYSSMKKKELVKAVEKAEAEVAATAETDESKTEE